MSERIPLYYTFGNHMHWVDMEWLWGYHVLPGSVRDMIRLCREAGVKGNVNFDGIGYEKLASEDPEAFAEVKAAIQEGLVEVVGGSYGQPYGLFHGGESNIRQRIFGARTCRRLFGVPVKTFWEEEFDFFPQLPQILKGVGIEYSSLFFQWTWHTPEVPREEVPVVWWEGQDGSRLLCATRNKLNLHQWPEDMEATFSSLAADAPSTEGPTPLILQWLELMPSPDWMCRSELILPKLNELFADERFEIKPCTLSEYLRGKGVSSDSLQGQDAPDTHRLEADATPVRRYTMDQVWHGLTLGKNGDNMRRLSRRAESSLLAAETFAAIAALFGRPYAQWDVYPTWELEEAWRELLSAQHHDNDECEGLCGHVGRFSYERSRELSVRVGRSNYRRIAEICGGIGDTSFSIFSGFNTRGLFASEVDGTPLEVEKERETKRMLCINPLGWEHEITYARVHKFKIPPFGWRLIDKPELPSREATAAAMSSTRPDFQVDRPSGRVAQIVSEEFPDGALKDAGAFSTSLRLNGEEIDVVPEHWLTEPGQKAHKVEGNVQEVHWSTEPCGDRGLQVSIWLEAPRPDPGLNSAYQAKISLAYKPRIISDQPYGIAELKPVEKGLRKYPTGDWMTSEQWFEEVRRPFTSLSFVDLVDYENPERGLLICHDGSQQWFFDEEDNAVRVILNAYDPWDEGYFQHRAQTNFLMLPHGPLRNSERWKLAQRYLRPVLLCPFIEGDEFDDLEKGFSAVSCDADNVALTAFYRETRDSAKGQVVHGADVLGVDYPYVLRMVELDGEAVEANLSFGATVERAFKTNLLGEPEEELEVVDNRIRPPLRPFEIATIYLDLVEGRKQVRDLDAKREIWATVHRVQ